MGPSCRARFRHPRPHRPEAPPVRATALATVSGVRPPASIQGPAHLRVRNQPPVERDPIAPRQDGALRRFGIDQYLVGDPFEIGNPVHIGPIGDPQDLNHRRPKRALTSATRLGLSWPWSCRKSSGTTRVISSNSASEPSTTSATFATPARQPPSRALRRA